MKISAGIVIKYQDSLLLCHPTNSPWKESFSFPKGEIEQGEDLIDGAIRECFEETGIKVSRDQIINKFCVPYRKGRNFYKKVYLYQINIDSLSDIGVPDGIVPKEKIQLSEVDWVGFLKKEELDERLFWRFKPILHQIFSE